MKPPPNNSARITMLLLPTLILAALFFIGKPILIYRLRVAAMAENMGNVRSLKLTMDSYAMDNDGVFPTEDQAEFYEIGGTDTSNDLFKQLFAGAYTESERIFWVKGSQVCSSSKPDEISTVGGKFNPNKTLEAGDNGWAYVKDQTITDDSARAILFDSPPTGSGLVFDPDLWGMRVIVVHIDGSVSAEPLNSANKLLDGDNKELFTSASDLWDPKFPPTIAYPLPK